MSLPNFIWLSALSQVTERPPTIRKTTAQRDTARVKIMDRHFYFVTSFLVLFLLSCSEKTRGGQMAGWEAGALLVSLYSARATEMEKRVVNWGRLTAGWSKFTFSLFVTLLAYHHRKELFQSVGSAGGQRCIETVLRPMVNVDVAEDF